MAPSAPTTAVFDPCFHTAAGPLEAGTAFALELPPLGTLLVTCQHLFGPAGGLSKDVPPALMGRFVQSVSVIGALGERLVAKAGASLSIPGVDCDDPAHDLAAFPLEPTPGVRALRIAESVDEHATVYLAARLRRGAPPGVFLFPASAPHPAEDGTDGIIFRDPEIHLPGTSGAPVIDEAGGLVGMVVRFRDGGGTMVGFLLPAARIRSQLLAATPPTPPKKGFFQRLFSR